MPVKHATASAFVFAPFPGGWRLGLVEHPRLHRRMIPGGHVEPDEAQDQAVVREVAEETGLTVRLVQLRRPQLPVGYPHRAVTPPWWINEMPTAADGHLDAAHIHVDHQYVAITDDPQPTATGAHPFGWHTVTELPDLSVFPDTRLLAATLFTCIDHIAYGNPDAALTAFEAGTG